MGKEAKVTKERVCKICKQSFYMTAKEIKAHAWICERANRLGLFLPGVYRPNWLGDLVKIVGDQDDP